MPGDNSAPIGPCRGSPHGAQGAVCREVGGLDVLIGQPGQDSKGVNRDGHGAGKGAKPKQKCGQQSQNEGREGAKHLNEQPKQRPEGPWGVEGLRAKRSQKQREKGTQRRAGDGHLKRGQQRRKDAGSIAPFRRQHGGEQVRQVAPAGPEQGGGAAGEPRRREKSRQKTSTETSRFRAGRLMTVPPVRRTRPGESPGPGCRPDRQTPRRRRSVQ